MTTPHLERARLLYSQGRYADAEKELGLVLAGDPENSLAHAMLALCLAERQQYDQATAHAQQAVALRPDAPETHHALAIVWFHRNYLDRAEAAVREAIALDPYEPNYHVLLGRIRYAGTHWQDAFQAAEEALALDPEHIGALNLRAEALRKMGRTGVAAEQLTAALRVDPDDPWTHANLGWTALERGDRAKAMQHFREALRLDPELDWAREGVVETLRAHNPFYRIMLKYFFWMQRLSTRWQWAVVIGLYIVYRMVNGLAESNASLRPWLTPLLWAYIAFALATWISRPLMNVLLRVHPFGRLALSADERRGTNWIGGFLLAGALCAVAYLLFSVGPALFGAGFFLLMILPLGLTVQMPAPWPRTGMWIYTGVVALLGISAIALVATLPSVDSINPLAGLCISGFLLGAFLSWLPANVLASVSWKR